MNRRIALKNLALIIGSAVTLPSLANGYHSFTVSLRHLQLTAEQQALLSLITETIIPRTDTPGAIDLGLPQFVAKMIDDCAGKKTQERFMSGLNSFEPFAKAQLQKPYAEASPAEREGLLIKIERSEGSIPADVQAFYAAVKNYTLFGYTNSKFYMTKQIAYELVPARYNALYNINTAPKHG